MRLPIKITGVMKGNRRGARTNPATIVFLVLGFLAALILFSNACLPSSGLTPSSLPCGPDTVPSGDSVLPSKNVKAVNFNGDPYDLSDVGEGVHVVYNIGCPTAKHWAIYTLDWSWNNTGHKGSLTRIVSGCPANDTLRELAARSPLKGHPRFNVFFAPSYESCQIPGFDPWNYAPRDKSFSVLYWLHQAHFTERYFASLFSLRLRL